ncbi:hypothetical protein A374_03774 [Fictibacillus macauensis ZFHKF-1]|uniref:Uncharacterized protein n=1 Tax=Fictibacillus macauensis ZFHKF-1 TaxID=1196324 RepID=I8ALY2_9BACL|nr:hypothetical protein A374_03774 [Fictibacillus macauensis ZFHKF-1]
MRWLSILSTFRRFFVRCPYCGSKLRKNLYPTAFYLGTVNMCPNKEYAEKLYGNGQVITFENDGQALAFFETSASHSNRLERKCS